MKNIDLKPCPFCGGKASIYHSAFFTCEAKVMCPTCRLQTATYKEPIMENAIWFAVNAWNRRMKE
jgi:Lar family restriction alleviation protein